MLKTIRNLLNVKEQDVFKIMNAVILQKQQCFPKFYTCVYAFIYVSFSVAVQVFPNHSNYFSIILSVNVCFFFFCVCVCVAGVKYGGGYLQALTGVSSTPNNLYSLTSPLFLHPIIF